MERPITQIHCSKYCKVSTQRIKDAINTSWYEHILDLTK
jgi:hypothetical protein